MRLGVNLLAGCWNKYIDLQNINQDILTDVLKHFHDLHNEYIITILAYLYI